MQIYAFLNSEVKGSLDCKYLGEIKTVTTTSDHTASFASATMGYFAKLGDKLLATTNNAVILNEKFKGKKLAPIVYFPIEDCNQELFHALDKATFCALKGQANYYSLNLENQKEQAVAWYYPKPYEQVSRINNHVAFYTDKILVEPLPFAQILLAKKHLRLKLPTS